MNFNFQKYAETRRKHFNVDELRFYKTKSSAKTAIIYYTKKNPTWDFSWSPAENGQWVVRRDK